MNTGISVSFSILDEVKANLTFSKNMKEEIGVDVYNKNDRCFTDICYPFSINDSDVVLEDRQNDFYQNIQLCEEGCKYKGINYEIKRSICQCTIIIDENEREETSLFNNVYYATNIPLFKCFSLVFKWKNLKNNISFYFIGGIYILELTTFIIFTLDSPFENILKHLVKEFDNPNGERKKTDKSEIVKFGGTVKIEELAGKMTFTHVNYEPVLAVPYDTPIVGFQNDVVNTLRLWSAEPVSNEFDYSSFSRGEFLKAISYKNSVEAISLVLYPEDSFYEGKMLRLKQQYFFVCAGLQSIIRRFKRIGGDIYELDEKIAIHINDTHPTLAIPELMRLLVDEEGMDWNTAWRITQNTISYTNHTILAEALEKWPIDMFKSLLPRIYMIVEEINRRFTIELNNKYPGQNEKIARMSIIGDGYVRMANLAIVGSHSVNGVAKLHTELLKKREMQDFYYMYPAKFNNKTNGITHRRWLLKSNPKLTELLKDTIGDSFVKHPTDLENFKNHLDNKAVLDSLKEIKKDNKDKLAKIIYKNKGIIVDPNSIFDVQVKRIHAYKRQTMNCLRIMHLYNQLLDNPNLDIVPRTFIFAGKAAPGYYLAKNIIELICNISEKINNDSRVNEKIKVIMLDNYSVSLAESIIPAADVSEQISTTTKEASGTSNMKFMMNGAITIATLDGANIEIKDEVGEDNIIIFGLTAEQVLDYYKNGGYSAWDVCNHDPRIKRVTDDLINGKYCSDKDRFRVIYENLLSYNDEFFVLKDFAAYIDAQDRIDKIYRDQYEWQKMCGVNIAHSGVFSSDRTIKEYATGIWGSGVLYRNL